MNVAASLEFVLDGADVPDTSEGNGDAKDGPEVSEVIGSFRSYACTSHTHRLNVGICQNSCFCSQRARKHHSVSVNGWKFQMQ